MTEDIIGLKVGDRKAKIMAISYMKKMLVAAGKNGISYKQISYNLAAKYGVGDRMIKSTLDSLEEQEFIVKKEYIDGTGNKYTITKEASAKKDTITKEASAKKEKKKRKKK